MSKKICIITCYHDPDYVRAKTLRAAVETVDNLELVVVKNNHRGVMRYLEVLWRILWVRLRLHPDIYLVTFRGYEIFPFVRLLTIGKTLWYDEFINPIEWAALEHKLIPDWKIFRLAYRILVWPVQLILTDTESHADLSARITGINRKKIVAIPVGSEGLKPVSVYRNKKPFTVFYYGTIKNPHGLHGVDVMIEAALFLKDQPIEFHFVGAGLEVEKLIHEATKEGARIRYDARLPFDKLMKQAAQAGVCLGGPFGDTTQSQYVITGKTYQFLQMAKPVIIGANKESHILMDKKNALIVPQGNALALADAISWASKHSDELVAIGKSGHELFKRHLSVESISRIIEKLSGI